MYYGGSLEYSTDPPFFAGATANLSCGIGYEPLENYTTSTCLSVGQWVPHKLQCECKLACRRAGKRGVEGERGRGGRRAREGWRAGKGGVEGRQGRDGGRAREGWRASEGGVEGRQGRGGGRAREGWRAGKGGVEGGQGREWRDRW